VDGKLLATAATNRNGMPQAYQDMQVSLWTKLKKVLASVLSLLQHPSVYVSKCSRRWFH
jgi:hypothetical protein